LFKIHNFNRKDENGLVEIDLFDLFQKEVFNYISFDTIGNVFIEIEKIENGITSIVKEKAERLNAGYIYNKLKGGYKKKDLLTTFKTGFENLITHISQRGSKILNEKFGYPINFKLTTNIDSFNSFKTGNPFIHFEILDYYGKTNKEIKNPQSFLNEAKWSAIGLSIRFAILERRSQVAEIKLLLLDDLMISLDMSNREKVMELLTNYLDKFQIFIFTHDKVLFDDIKSYFSNYYKNIARKNGIIDDTIIDTYWNDYFHVSEMYESKLNEIQNIPVIVPSNTHLQKAHYYLKINIDYNACANNLRCAFEDFFRDYLPKKILRDENGQPYLEKSLMLGALLVLAKKYFTEIGFDLSLIDKLDRYKERSLNPSSHFNPKTNFFKKELEDAFIILNQLKANKNDAILKKDSEIKFSITTQSGKVYEYTAIILDDICLYKKNDVSPSFFRNADQREYCIKSCFANGKLKTYDNVTSPETLLELYNETANYIEKIESIIRETNIYEVFKDVNGKTLEQLKIY